MLWLKEVSFQIQDKGEAKNTPRLSLFWFDGKSQRTATFN